MVFTVLVIKQVMFVQHGVQKHHLSLVRTLSPPKPHLADSGWLVMVPGPDRSYHDRGRLTGFG